MKHLGTRKWVLGVMIWGYVITSTLNVVYPITQGASIGIQPLILLGGIFNMGLARFVGQGEVGLVMVFWIPVMAAAVVGTVFLFYRGLHAAADAKYLPFGRIAVISLCVDIMVLLLSLFFTPSDALCMGRQWEFWCSAGSNGLYCLLYFLLAYREKKDGVFQ